MKSVLQDYRKGQPAVIELPTPAIQEGGILVRNTVSLISAGTERHMVELARKSAIGKARERPDLVRKVLEKARKDGIQATFDTVRSRLDNLVAMGYSSAGTVIEVGKGVHRFRVGDRVSCAGTNHARHSEIVSIPKNLAVALPDDVDFESAAFTTLGAIALQGLRLAGVELGGTTAVIGLGLVGLLTTQLAKAAGCRVLGFDTDPGRCRLSLDLGLERAVSDADEFRTLCRQQTAGHGVDTVIIAASTKSSEPLQLAGELARPRGTVVAVGDVGMQVPRTLFYDKELTFKVSRSYGPGRYDKDYEEKGHDYPIAYVRWTENRNMGAFVEQLRTGRVEVEPLISHRFPIEEAATAYELLTGKHHEPHLAILLRYPPSQGTSPIASERQFDDESSDASPSRPAPIAPSIVSTPSSIVSIGMLGAGQFASGTLIPELKQIPGVKLVGISSANGVTARHAADRFGFEFATTESTEKIIKNEDIDAVIIATRHNHHYKYVAAALKARKKVFVEKSLCLTRRELAEIRSLYNAEKERGNTPFLMMGYNRRFAPMSKRLKEFFSPIKEPLVMNYRINAGYISLDHWIHDLEQGGGRIIGEVCHFVDFFTFLTGDEPKRVTARALPNGDTYRDDNLVATIEFGDCSIGTVTYVANGDSSLPKERLEVFGGRATAVLDNFRSLELMSDGKRKKVRSPFRQNKGHGPQLEEFVEAIRSGDGEPVPWPDAVLASKVTFAIVECLRDGSTITL